MCNRRSCLVAVIVVLASLPFSGAMAGSDSSGRADAALDRALERLVAMPGGPPGVIALVQRGGQLIVHRAGVADVETGRQPQSDDAMRIASVSKAFSGGVTLSLVDKGVLALDDDIGKLIDYLLRHNTHAVLAESLVLKWARSDRSATEAAWLLEYARSEREAYDHYAARPSPPHLDVTPSKGSARIQSLITDEQALRVALRDVSIDVIPSTASPTYWPDLIRQLRLAAA